MTANTTKQEIPENIFFLSLQDYTLSSNTTYNLDTLIRLLKAESLYEIVRKKIE